MTSIFALVFMLTLSTAVNIFNIVEAFELDTEDIDVTVWTLLLFFKVGAIIHLLLTVAIIFLFICHSVDEESDRIISESMLYHKMGMVPILGLAIGWSSILNITPTLVLSSISLTFNFLLCSLGLYLYDKKITDEDGDLVSSAQYISNKLNCCDDTVLIIEAVSILVTLELDPRS